MPLLILALSGCFVADMLGGDDGEAVAAAEEKLRAGDLAGAEAAYAAIVAENAASVDGATGAAYLYFLKGDHDKADATLAAAEAEAGERLGEIKMRRALVALAKGDTDGMKTHAEASGLPAGKLLVAEAALADGEREQAVTILEGISGDSGAVGKTAKDYLSLLKDPDPTVAGLAENYALWALGQRRVAVQSVEEVVKAIPEDSERKAGELLVWAGRAAAEGETQVASNLLEAITFPPAGQAWRVPATRAIIQCADKEYDACVKGFQELETVAPPDGLADARATAAMVIGNSSPETVAALLQGASGNAAAWAMTRSGGDGAALSPEGLLSTRISGK